MQHNLQHDRQTFRPTDALSNPLFWLCITIPVAIHFLLLFLYAVNAPRLDDFSEVLTFLPDWHATTNINEKLTVFFRDYQNHRYVLYHALLVLFDHINFRTAALVGNLPLLVLCGCMMKCVAGHPQKKILWLMTPLLVFNLQSWRAMFWGPLGTTNLLYPAIGLLTCWLATQSTRGVMAAGCAAVALTLSHGSGPLLFPVIAGYLWFQRAQKPLLFIPWTIVSLVILVLYFVAFPLHGGGGFTSVGSSELISNTVAHVALTIKGFFVLLGSHLLYNETDQQWHATLAMALGASELCWLIWLTRQGVWRDMPALRLWLGFLLLVSLSIAMGRVVYGGIDQALQGHYKLLNGLFLWLLMVGTLQWIHDKKPTWQSAGQLGVAACTLLLYVSALLLFISPLQQFQQSLVDDITQWQHSGKLQHNETRLFVKQPNIKLKAAIDGGFYDPAQ